MESNTQLEIRDKSGRFLPGKLPPGAAPAITSDNAREMVQKRTEKYRRAAAAAIAKESGAIGMGGTPMQAWGHLVASHYVKLLDSDKPRLLDVKILGQLIGAVGKDDEKSADQPALVLNTQGAAIVSKLLDLIKEQIK